MNDKTEAEKSPLDAKNRPFEDVILTALTKHGKAIILQSDAGSNAGPIVKGQLTIFLPLLKGEKSNEAHLECCLLAAKAGFEAGVSVRALMNALGSAPFSINNPSAFKQFIDRHLRILEKLEDGTIEERSFEGGRVSADVSFDFLGL